MSRTIQKQHQSETDYYTVFNNYLLKLFSTIRENTDGLETKVSKAYKKYCDTQVDTYIDYTLGKLRPHMKLILEEDNFLFSTEYSKNPMKLISGIDFKLFWGQLENKYKIREEIWGLIQSLYVAGSFALGVGTRDNVVKQILRATQDKDHLEKQVDNDLEKEEAEERALAEKKRSSGASGPGLMGGLGSIFSNLVKAGAGDELNNLGTSDATGMPSMESLEKLFSEDNLLVKLTKEVGDEMMGSNDFKKLGINPKQQVENPMEAINMLFGPDSNKLQGLVQMFGERLEKKMKEKNLDGTDIQQATTEIGQKVMDQFAGIMPGLPDMSQLNPENLQNMSPEERQKMQEEMQQKLFSGLTQGMSEEEKERFSEMNKYMFESMEKGESNNTEDMQEIMMTAWEEAKVKHLESIGGIEIENPEEELDDELMNTLSNVTPVAKKGEFCYVVCGEAVMKVLNTEWDNFMQNCKDQSAEISKHIDHDWIRQQIQGVEHMDEVVEQDDYDADNYEEKDCLEEEEVVENVGQSENAKDDEIVEAEKIAEDVMEDIAKNVAEVETKAEVDQEEIK